MTPDHLLFWLSAKGGGSWSQFRAAVEELRIQQANVPVESGDEEDRVTTSADLPLYQEVRFTMQRLGHVEFFATEVENGWRTVPPVVAFFLETPEQGLLCGARSPELLDKLHSLNDVDVLVSETHGGPHRVVLRGSSQDVVAVRAKALGLHVQKAASVAILSSLPRIRDPNAWRRLLMPETTGWDVHRFSASRLQWRESSQSDAASAYRGLFRFRMGYQHFYFLCWQGTSYHVPAQVGKYAVMHKRRGILKYDSGSRMLTVPVVYRPPLLIERALILCSGLLPRFNPKTRCLEYFDIPQEVVRIAAQLLEQETR